jgi:hypothetical protein
MWQDIAHWAFDAKRQEAKYHTAAKQPPLFDIMIFICHRIFNMFCGLFYSVK